MNYTQNVTQGLDGLFCCFQSFLQVKDCLFGNKGAAAVTHSAYGVEAIEGTYNTNNLLLILNNNPVNIFVVHYFCKTSYRVICLSGDDFVSYGVLYHRIPKSFSL